jgi:hypothetical protein
MEQGIDESVEQVGRLDPARGERRYLRQSCAWVFIISFVVFALSPVITNYDSYSTLPTAISLVNRQSPYLTEYAKVPTIANSYTVSRVNGRLVTEYPWSDAVFFIPTVLLVDGAHVVGGPSASKFVTRNDMGLLQMETASLVTALACAVLSWLAFERFGGALRRRRYLTILCGLAFAFGTSAWSIASRSLWQHGPSLLLLGLGLVGLNRLTKSGLSDRQRGRSAILIGASFAGALTIRPTNVIPLAVVAIALLIRFRTSFVRFIVGALAVIVPWVLLTYLIYGSLLQPYDAGDSRGLQHAFLEALAANLVSPARGILIFSPIVLAAIGGIVVARHRGRLDLLELVSIVVVPLQWVLVSVFGSEWWAGNTYGPRFMSESLPFIFVLSLPFVSWLLGPGDLFRSRWQSPGIRLVLAATVLLLFASIAVNAEGGVLRSTTCWNTQPVNVDSDPGRVWSWSDPKFLTGFRSLSSGSIQHSVLSTCQ